MITQEKIAIYQKYAGDIDGWARIGTADEKTVLCDSDWHEISSFIQDYWLVKAGLASQRYAVKLESRLTESSADAATAQALKELVENSR